MKIGERVRVNPSELEGRIYAGRVFIVDGEIRKLGGADVVALNNPDGTRFSAAYDVSMLQVIDAGAY